MTICWEREFKWDRSKIYQEFDICFYHVMRIINWYPIPLRLPFLMRQFVCLLQFFIYLCCCCHFLYIFVYFFYFQPQSQINKCNNEKRRRELENEYIEQLGEFLQINKRDMTACKPDKAAILSEVVKKVSYWTLEKNENISAVY